MLIAAAQHAAGRRLAQIAALGDGYTYCVARAGVTGADEEARVRPCARCSPPCAKPARRRRSSASASRRPAHVRAALAAGAAGVISGSAIVELVARGAPVGPFVAEMKTATYPSGDGGTG